MIHWLAINWDWAKVLGGIALFLLFGVVVIEMDDDGDWFVL